RLERQLSEIRFMKENDTATDWIGVVAESHSTKEGDLWLTVRLPSNVRISTEQSRNTDTNSGTLIGKGTPLYRVVDRLEAGQPVSFSAVFLGGVIGPDEEMVNQPQIIARFTAIRSAR